MSSVIVHNNIWEIIRRLPGITILSHLGHLAIVADHVPISLPPKYWTYDKLGYPWNVQLTDMSISTIQKEQHFDFLKRNTTNIIISVNDMGTLSVDVHVDMKPLEVNFMLDQVRISLDLWLIETYKNTLMNIWLSILLMVDRVFDFDYDHISIRATIWFTFPYHNSAPMQTSNRNLNECLKLEVSRTTELEIRETPQD